MGMVEMKEKAIICTILLLMAYAVCGCEEEQPLTEWHWDTIIEERRADGYYIIEITMKKWTPDYQAIYERALSAEEIADINQRITERENE